MYDADQQLLYVGKAKNTRKRVTSYASPQRQSIRIQRMISQTIELEIVNPKEVDSVYKFFNILQKINDLSKLV